MGVDIPTDTESISLSRVAACEGLGLGVGGSEVSSLPGSSSTERDLGRLGELYIFGL